MVSRVTVARSLRWLLLVGYVTVVYAAGMAIAIVLIGPSGPGVIAMSFAAAAVSVAGAGAVRRQIDRLIRRMVLRTPLSPYHALAAAAGRLQVGSWEQALPGLARALAEGTSARHASVWLQTDAHLVSVATWPSALGGFVRTVADLDALRALPDVDHAVPVLDGNAERGALTIHKPSPALVSQDDRRLMRDVANTAGLLLRGLALNAELRERVRLAEKLEEELRASRRRVMQARDIERRRSVTEITTVTAGSLAAIRAELAHIGEVVTEDPEAAERMLARVRPELEELIERFRAVVRGVFPGVLRDEGPRVALEEFAGDLPRPVHLTGELGQRMDWEIESGIYFVAAAAMRLLCQGAAADPLRVHLGHDAGRLTVRIVDLSGETPSLTDLREALTDQEDRLAALGGGLRLDETPTRIAVVAWLPDRLQPVEALALTSGVPPVTDDAEDTAAPAGDSRAAACGGRGGHSGRVGHSGVPGPDADSVLGRTAKLANAVCAHYGDDSDAGLLLETANRLDEPLRVAIFGPAKAGKSTLLNALVGTAVAATGPGGTRVPTWYRGGVRAKVTLHTMAGPPRHLPYPRQGDATAVLDDFPIEEVQRLVVDWPSPVLRAMTLIDLPGVDYAHVDAAQLARSLFAPGEYGIAHADAALYVCRRLGPGDLEFMETLQRERTRGGPPVSILTVLSFADEAGQLSWPATADADVLDADVLATAKRIAAGHERDPRLSRLCQGVVPVAGLLAASAANVEETEYEALRQLARLREEDGRRLFLSTATFACSETPEHPAAAVRAVLLRRFGLVGVRVAVGLIRGGRVGDRTELSAALLRHSGIQSVRDMLSSRLAERAGVVKARSALLAVDAVLRGSQAGETHRAVLGYDLEQIRDSAHELAEIDLLGALRRHVSLLSAEDHVLAEQLLGANGTDPRARLALPSQAGPEEIRRAASWQLAQWQRRAEDFAFSREVREVCRAVVRTCEGLLQQQR